MSRVIAPLQHPFLDQNGRITRPWLEWFRQTDTASNEGESDQTEDADSSPPALNCLPLVAELARALECLPVLQLQGLQARQDELERRLEALPVLQVPGLEARVAELESKIEALGTLQGLSAEIEALDTKIEMLGG